MKLSMPHHDKVLLSCLVINETHTAQLTEFFRKLECKSITDSFHPHPFTREMAKEIATYCGEDIYVGVFLNGTMAAYGMLRGWDEGFIIPSLGIVVDPALQGKGLGSFLMSYLHCQAKLACADKVRLKVYCWNTKAIQLYERFGYIFQDGEQNQLIGVKNLV